MHSLNHLACRGSVWEQQANSNDAGDWESLPPNFMHNKWEITCFLPAEILNGKRVSLGGDEESFPSLSIFSPSTAWDSGSSQGTGIGAAIQQRVCSCSAGLLIHLHSRQQQANLNRPGRAPPVLEPSCHLSDAKMVSSPWSLHLVHSIEEQWGEIPRSFFIFFSPGQRKSFLFNCILWQQNFLRKNLEFFCKCLCTGFAPQYQVKFFFLAFLLSACLAVKWK